jgi:hypothetical protein
MFWVGEGEGVHLNDAAAATAIQKQCECAEIYFEFD